MNYKYPYEDSPESWKDLDAETQTELCDWIKENIIPRKTGNRWHTSYGLKHIFTHDTGSYVYNGQFKAAIELCGFEAVNRDDQNWYYRISESSPAFDSNRPSHK